MTTLNRETTHRTTPALRGAFTALVTPFTSDGALDEHAYRRLAAWQVMAGIDGLVPVGTTGESPTLTAEERDTCIRIAVETVAARPSRHRDPGHRGHRFQRHPQLHRGHPAGRGHWAPMPR